MKASTVLCTVALLSGAQQAMALDPRYGTAVEILRFHDNLLFEGQGSAGGAGSYAFGGDATGGASFAQGLSVDASDVQVTSGIGVVAYVFDTFTFRVAGGGGVDVPLQMSGNWTAAGNGSKVSYLLSWTDGAHSTKTYEGYSYSNGTPSNGLAESFVNDVPVSPALLAYAGDPNTGVFGSYTVDALFHIVDGGVYMLVAEVRADVVGDTAASIDDPLSIALAEGVTFTAASGSPYSIASPAPEPSTWFLMSAGLIGMGWLRRRRRPRV
jgi:PEP-CTERM motif